MEKAKVISEQDLMQMSVRQMEEQIRNLQDRLTKACATVKAYESKYGKLSET